MRVRHLGDGRRWRRPSLLAVSLVLLAFASACSESPKPSAASDGTTPGIGKEEGMPVGSVSKKAAKPRAQATKAPASPGGKARAAQASPSPFAPPFPADPSVVVDASLSPTCAHRGTTMTLVVDTGPKAAIGYQAVYSDNRGGGPPPYGAGYGGNGKGFSDENGHFTSSWVISSDAPTGKARVDVVVAYEGNRWGYESLTFDVGPDSACA